MRLREERKKWMRWRRRDRNRGRKGLKSDLERILLELFRTVWGMLCTLNAIATHVDHGKG